MSSSLAVAWIVVNAVHYHRARWQAVASQPDIHADLIAIRAKDEVSVLETEHATSCSYRTKVLFPDEQPKSRRTVKSALSRYLTETNPDIVCLNGWSLYGSWEGLSWCNANRKKAILMCDSNEHDAPRRWLSEKIKSSFVRSCSAALVGGQTNASYLRKLGMADDQIFLGYDVVDNDHFSSKSTIARATEPSVRKKLGLPRRYILACARFTLKKNLPFLVTAYSSFVRRFGSDAPSLVMLGDGPLRSELESLTLSLNLKHKVHFHGFQSYETIPSYYALAEAFVHPSTVEQWGLVVNEAMACGTPVLVSKPCGAAAELVKEGVTGYTFDPQNRDELAARIYDLTSDPERRAGLSRNCLDEIALWSPARFVSGLRQAMHRARGDYRGPSPLNRLLARGLSGLR